jgi:hypothetical protein
MEKFETAEMIKAHQASLVSAYYNWKDRPDSDIDEDGYVISDY